MDCHHGGSCKDWEESISLAHSRVVALQAHEETYMQSEKKGTAWQESSTTYRFHILLTRDDADSYSAVVLNLPGAGSCGSTEEEAMENVQEALQGVLDSYKASGQDIPWKDSSAPEIPPGAKQKWISLNV
jgi:predicted RNase H-like HicB family nuclease